MADDKQHQPQQPDPLTAGEDDSRHTTTSTSVSEERVSTPAQQDHDQKESLRQAKPQLSPPMSTTTAILHQHNSEDAWSRGLPDEPPSETTMPHYEPESSYLDPVTMEPTHMPDESITEAAVRAHLQDVESSFMPALSPIPTASTNGDGGVDDTYQFDSPNKAAMQSQKHDDSAGPVTISLEHLDSSPMAAAAARTASRTVSHATRQPNDDSQPISQQEEEDENDQDHSFASSLATPSEGLSRSHSGSGQRDVGSNSGYGVRSKKYLRSRYSSQRSSTSSFATNTESHEGSEATVNHGADYALQSGGAVPAMLRNASNPMPRSISMGSMASGFDDYTDSSVQQLETLDEVDSPDQKTNGDLLKTPKPSKENLNVPTDTVIARHVRNVHVPDSLAKEYKFKSGMETPWRSSGGFSASTTRRSMTLKEQSSTIERLSKENFDLKLKVMFLSDRLDKLSEEGIKEMISENVELKTSLAVLQRDNKVLRKRVKELEKQAKEDERPSTARSAASSTDQTARLYDEGAAEREEELFFLRERVEEYALEIERLRNESLSRENEKRKMADIVQSLSERTGNNLGRQEEADVWKDLLEQETSRREQADDDNRKLREEIFRMKQEMTAGGLHHTTNIYNITRKRDRKGSNGRPISGMSGELEGSTANLSTGTTLVEELKRESEQLRHENAELRREVGAQTSMLTSRNREKERLYQEIEDLKMAQRRGAPSTLDSLLDRSASRAGGHDRPGSRGSAKTRATWAEDDPEKEEMENKLAEARDKVSEVKLQNQELQRELETCMQDFEAAVEGKREMEEQALGLQEELDNAMSDLVVLQSERDEALQEQENLEGEFEALRKEAQEEIDALEGEADQHNDEIQRLQEELQETSENFIALQEEMRKMSESLLLLEDEQNNKMRRIQELEEEIESSSKELEDLESKLVESNEKNERLAVQQESSQGEIAFLREEQEGDKIRIGDLEALVANLEQTVRDEKERAKEIDTRLQEERRQREVVASKEKEDVQQFVNDLNREASTAKDEVRRLRKNLSSREVEAAEWKERLLELESNLREALGDLNGTRSSLLKSIAKMQRELENTIRDLDTAKASVLEKDRIIKQRDTLLESHGLESRKLSELLEREKTNHRNTKSQFETFQKTHQHLSSRASTQDNRITELESTRGADKRRIAMLEQNMREQLLERNQLLLTLWQKLSTICGKEWVHGNSLIDRQVLPSVEVVATRLPGFSKNLMSAIKAIEVMIGSFQVKIKSVERDLFREYQTLESTLDARTKKLDRLETMVRNSVASGTLGSHDVHARMLRLEEAYRQLKVENATLRAAHDVRQRAGLTYSVAGGSQDVFTQHEPGSPSPAVPRGPGERDRDRSSHHSRSHRTSSMTRANTTSGASQTSSGNGGGMDVALADDTNNDNRWLLRLRDMEHKLKMEREGRNQDRHAARQRLGGLETENRDLRERARRGEN